MKIKYQIYNSMAGDLKIASYNNNLIMCDWVNRRNRISVDNKISKKLETSFLEASSDIINITILQLEEYFDGKRTCFDLPINPIGTEFQKLVWSELFKVHYSNVSTYKDVAIAINKPTGYRAVANAIGANLISIIIPCHRIIGQNGKLTGYAGGVLAKKILLNVENIHKL